MVRLKRLTKAASWLVAFWACAGSTHATEISGTISTTLTIMDDSKLVGDVTCTVTGAACIAFGADGLTLDLNGFTMTGRADPATACFGGATAGTGGEFGIVVNGVNNVTIRGSGLVQRFRAQGIQLIGSSGSTIRDVTSSTNCASGFQVNNGTNNLLENNVSVRNGHPTAACGGIWLAGGASRNRLRANRVSGNGLSAPGNNFGIGTPGGATATGNIIEENIIVGNADGIILFPGAAENLLRKNFIMGNPGVEASVDHPSATSGFDVLNLATPGANAFVGNTCATSINAPCPSVGPSLAANPNPIPVTGNALVGSTTLSWNAPDAEVIEIRIGSPDGALFTTQGNRGSVQTGNWVREGLTFYLQDVTGGKPLTSDYTLAELVVHLQRK